MQIPSWLSAAKTLTDLLAFCEFSFGADIIVAILAQGVAAMSEAAAMGEKGA